MKLNLDLKSIRSKINKFIKTASRRGVFIIMIAVLASYLFMVWKISSLAAADPSPEAESEALLSSSNIPKIDSEAIKKIQSLEESSSELRSLFNKARNNPFQE